MAGVTKKSFEYKPPDPGSVPLKVNAFQPSFSDVPHDQFGNPIIVGNSTSMSKHKTSGKVGKDGGKTKNNYYAGGKGKGMSGKGH